MDSIKWPIFVLLVAMGREDAGPGQDGRQPIDDLRPAFGKCCGALR
jgi:hypothetical protein